MNYSVRAFLWKYKKNAKGIYPIKIMVTVNRKQTPLPTPHKVHIDQWDPEKAEVCDHANARQINGDLKRLIVQKELELMTASRTGEKVNKDFIKGKKLDNSLVKFAQAIAKKVKDNAGKEITDPQIVKEINRVIDYKGAGALLVEVDVKWLREFNDYESKRGMAQNTRNTTFKWLRRVITQAASEKLIRENPFDLYDIPEYIQGDTVYLVDEEKAALFALLEKDLAGPLHLTLCYYLAACYCGFRQSDWHKIAEPERVYDSFFRIRPHKRSTGFVVQPIGPTLQRLLNRVYELNEPPLSLQKSNVYIKALFAMAEVKINGRTVLGIRKDGTSHSARHSFGYMCASLGLPKSTTAELMGITVQTVEVYYHLSGDNILKQAAALRTV